MSDTATAENQIPQAPLPTAPLEPEGEKRRLTLEDPVPRDILERLKMLHDSRLEVADNFLALEQEKVKLLAAAKRIDEEKNRVFEALLMDRGLPPQTPVEIDGPSGKIKPLGQPAKAAEA